MIKAKRSFEAFASTVNDLDRGLPKGRSRCFDIGIWGGCGLRCAAFVDGECPEPQEFDAIYGCIIKALQSTPNSEEETNRLIEPVN